MKLFTLWAKYFSNETETRKDIKDEDFAKQLVDDNQGLFFCCMGKNYNEIKGFATERIRNGTENVVYIITEDEFDGELNYIKNIPLSIFW